MQPREARRGKGNGAQEDVIAPGGGQRRPETGPSGSAAAMPVSFLESTFIKTIAG